MVMHGVDDLGNALAEQLPQGVHVVGVDGHDVAVGVGVKVLDGQRLHAGGTGRRAGGSMVPWLTLTMMRL